MAARRQHGLHGLLEDAAFAVLNLGMPGDLESTQSSQKLEHLSDSGSSSGKARSDAELNESFTSFSSSSFTSVSVDSGAETPVVVSAQNICSLRGRRIGSRRRKLSSSLAAVAARKLRSRKKRKENDLVAKCEALRDECATLDHEREVACEKLCEQMQDNLQLRGLTQNQDWLAGIIAYMRLAPFPINLNLRNIERLIFGDDEVDGTNEKFSGV